MRAVLYPYANLIIIPYLRAGVRIDHRRTPHPRSVRLRTALRLRTSPSNARSPSLPYSIFTLYIKAYERYTTLEKIPFSAMRPQLILFAHSADLLSTSVAKKKIDPFTYRKSEEKIQPSPDGSTTIPVWALYGDGTCTSTSNHVTALRVPLITVLVLAYSRGLI